jgi:phenylacetic acid degradation operon negative regulatory protein
MIPSRNTILSIVAAEPPTELVYSLLSAYGRRRGGELPGAWFVAVLQALRHKPASVRQALFRLTRTGALEARKDGRLAWYRLSSYGQAAIATGSDKLFTPPSLSWDGRWTLVFYQFDTGSRDARDQAREILELEGFALFGRGVYIHPHEQTERVLNLLREVHLEDRVTIFHGRRLNGESDSILAARLWNLRRLERGYSQFLKIFEPLADRPATAWTPAEAFAGRLALACKFLRTAWDDPRLPPALLPVDWSGHRARRVAARLYEKLMPGTLQHGDAIAGRLGISILGKTSTPSNKDFSNNDFSNGDLFSSERKVP